MTEEPNTQPDKPQQSIYMLTPPDLQYGATTPAVEFDDFYTRKSTKVWDFIAGFGGAYLLHYLWMFWGKSLLWGGPINYILLYTFISIVIIAVFAAIFPRRRFITWGITSGFSTLIVQQVASIFLILDAFRSMN
ncbi:MAG: hypothetical protein WCJ56_08070 [bacterium]